ncbi:MAG TPA: hypothetical protein VFF06_26285 [Polyangia bacterium]|nr:hypothetical protein [Polyangia bacterium]
MTATADPIPDVPAAGSIPSLRDLLDAALDHPPARAVAEPFLAELARPERSVRAVVLYGSCLWSGLRGPTSHPDFFVVVDSLRAWHRRLWPTLLNVLLPPSIYRLRAGALEAKVSITSAAQLARHVSPDAPDLHHLGRWSKRVALVWSRDAASRRLVVDAQQAALETLAPLARARLGDDLGVDEFMHMLLRLSYEAEVRIAEHGKVAALFEVEREHYRAIGRALVAGLPPGRITPAEVERRLRRSRRRAVLRWPKYICTYDGWLDYVLAKLARTGDRWSLSERERRHPLLFGIPVIWRLARAKRLSGGRHV